VSYWHAFVSTFFSPRGVYRLTLPVTGSDPANEDHGNKQYEIVQPALARFFHTHFQSGIERIQLSFEKVTQEKQLPNGCHFVENPKANMVYWFENSHVRTAGCANVLLMPQLACIPFLFLLILLMFFCPGRNYWASEGAVRQRTETGAIRVHSTRARRICFAANGY